MWVELMEVQNAYIAETWRELFAAEGLKLLVVPLTICGGCLEVPKDPGTGIEIDEAKLDHYRIR